MVSSEDVFKGVLNVIENSSLNFTLHQTPYSAQISLKKSFIKHFAKDVVESDPVVTKEQFPNTETKKLESDFAQVKADFIEMEKLKSSEIDELKRKLKDFEIKQENLEGPIKDKNKHIHNLEKKVSKLEEALEDHKVRMTEINRERNKVQKDFRKIKKKLDQKVKVENLEEDEVIDDIPLCNSYNILSNLNDEEDKGESFKCEICENRMKRTNLKMEINNTNEISPIEKKTIETQTNSEHVEENIRKDNVFVPYMIASTA